MLRVHLLNSGTTLFLRAGDYHWGRSGENDIIIPDDTVSRHHVRTWYDEDQWWIQDLGSTNGTFFNGELLDAPAPLDHEASIQTGKVPFTLTPWDKDDVLPDQIRKPPLKLDLGESTHNVREDEREQIQTGRAFFDLFMAMESTGDFYRSDLPDLFDKMGIQGFGVIVRGKSEPLLLFAHGRNPENLLADSNHMKGAFLNSLMVSDKESGVRCLSSPVLFQHQQLCYYVTVINGNYKEGLPPFIHTRLTHLAKLIYLINRKPAHKKRIRSEEDLGFDDEEHSLLELPQLKTPILFSSQHARKLLQTIMRLAPDNSGVILEGETGVGKEIVAALIHHYSRRQGPFLPIMTSSLPEHLVENELFGHQKGAYSGATSREKGKFATADGGTVFLDEVADMPAPIQAKLLRVLESGEVFPIGAHTPEKVDVRVIAASNIPFSELIESKRLRRDLYFRLKTFNLVIQPLRQRREEVLPLFEFFLCRKLAKRKKPFRGISPKAVRLLLEYPWPGNVRELKNEADRVGLLMKNAGVVHADMLNDDIRDHSLEHTVAMDENDIKGKVDQLELRMITRVLAETGGNRTRAAQKLGLSRKGLFKKMTRLGIE
ncbi:MAG TPA: FHA domain-containing protein [Candidatus Aminicenantes bacterium]|nr:FHA domain-containing protein [Candidatus Aminicenantes bacterium]